MKFLNFLLPALFCLILIACGHRKKGTKISKSSTDLPKTENTFKVLPIQHATMALEWNGIIIYVDPVGGENAFKGQPLADLILITDIHGDHFSLATLEELNTEKAKIIVPPTVADNIPAAFTPQLDVLANGEKKERYGITVEAIPMYNIWEETLKLHVKGRGNGYIMEMKGERIYISGNTQDIPKMWNLKDIDKAFISMNLPYTMSIESAVDAVLEFQPKEMYPYHYRGKDGFSDVQKFKALVDQANQKMTVNLLDWYPK